MPGLVNVLVIVAVVALVIARQFRARPIGTDRRWWLLPVILAVVSLREPGVLDAHHRAESAVLLVVELFIGLVTGVGWGWTTRIWTAPDGVVWTRSSKASGAVWIVGIALRAGVFALGSALGVHQDSSALMLGLAGTLLVRGAILAWRAQSLGAPSHPAPSHPAPSRPAPSRPAPAYGDDERSAWKERV
ncbi:DUF1453 domain-containing protein [Streptomyces sp. NPDC047841]|uniref:DUF1453 domain-containing protein n=1 Tax=Streptomyces sp. NPDC047841 TaxID=3154708 RepID=UPI003454D68B